MEFVNDQELVRQLQGGSLEALGGLYDRHRQMVFRTALAITGDQDTANDLLQEVFLRLFRFAGRIDIQRPLQPWLYRMTANLAYTWLKRDRRWFRPLENLADWLAGSTRNMTHEAVESIDDWDRLQRSVAKLPISQRMVVVLYYLDDLSMQEISEILEIPVGTVKSRLHYGRLSLKKDLNVGVLIEGEKLADLRLERT